MLTRSRIAHHIFEKIIDTLTLCVRDKQPSGFNQPLVRSMLCVLYSVRQPFPVVSSLRRFTGKITGSQDLKIKRSLKIVKGRSTNLKKNGKPTWLLKIQLNFKLRRKNKLRTYYDKVRVDYDNIYLLPGTIYEEPKTIILKNIYKTRVFFSQTCRRCCSTYVLYVHGITSTG